MVGYGIKGLAEVKEDCIDVWGFGLIQDGCPTMYCASELSDALFAGSESMLLWVVKTELCNVAVDIVCHSPLQNLTEN